MADGEIITADQSKIVFTKISCIVCIAYDRAGGLIMTACFAIFEGGGAKGLAHVGAIKAAEEANLEFVGVAGASAGSIVAALVAAGFRADDLFNPQLGVSSLFADLNWLDILGTEPWAQFNAFLRDAAAAIPAGQPGIRDGWRIWSLLRTWSGTIGATARDRGFFSTDRFEKWFNDTLCRKLGMVRHIVSFDDLYKRVARPIPLKLVSVDIEAQELVTYSLDDTPNLSVAKAVAASISIPFFFKPTIVNGRPMVDGGLMSNFPAWLFESERAILPPFTRTYGFTLGETSQAASPADSAFRTLLSYAGTVVQTGIFGGQALLNRSIELIQVVPIRTGVSVVAFDLDAQQKIALYNEGREDTRAFFHNQGVVDDNAVTAALKSLSEQLLSSLGLSNILLRANVMLPVKEEFLRVMYTYNMQQFADDRLLLNQNQTGAGQAFQQTQTVLTDMRAIRQSGGIQGLSKYDQALVPSHIVSLISVPIFRSDADWTNFRELRAPPLGILNFDSNIDILPLFNRADTQQFVAKASIVLGRLLRAELRRQT
jgi:NTE family protein